jgi:hypothetical protein
MRPEAGRGTTERYAGGLAAASWGADRLISAIGLRVLAML